MPSQVLRVPVAAAITLAMAAATYAKVPLDRITVSRGELTEPITIVDQDALRLSNPWDGNIADWKRDVAPPSDERAVYEITLQTRLRSPQVRPIYLLRYVAGRDGQPGFVYLPGKGETWYRQNVSIIYREGHDGHWHATAPEWEACIRRALGLSRLGGAAEQGVGADEPQL